METLPLPPSLSPSLSVREAPPEGRLRYELVIVNKEIVKRLLDLTIMW